MKYILLLCTIIFVNTLSAQDKPTQSPEDVTLQGVFDIAQAHKDGFEFNGRVADFPSNIAKLCDKKNIQVTGREVYYYGNTVKELEVKEKDGTITHKQGRVGDYTMLIVKTVSLFNDKTGKWEVVYTKK